MAEAHIITTWPVNLKEERLLVKTLGQQPCRRTLEFLFPDKEAAIQAAKMIDEQMRYKAHVGMWAKP